MTGKASQTGAAVVVLLMIAGVVLAIAIYAVMEQRSKHHVVEARFWFDDVTFELSGREKELGGPITDDEKRIIQSIASSELRSAFSALRIRFSDRPGGIYRVRVVQQFPARRGPANPVGRSLPLGPLGGIGSVSFAGVAALAIYHAPPDADRAVIIEGIGRGIGRTAAHEFGHQILFGEGVRPSTDDQSYEYESPDRAAQYYGSLHWDTAWPILVKKLGR